MSRDTEMLLDVLEERPGLVGNKQCAAFPNSNAIKRGWEEVAQKLNKCGIYKQPKSFHEVRKKWIDLKYRTKKKASALKKLEEEGISEVPCSMTLTTNEKRTLALMEQSSSEADFIELPYTIISSDMLLPNNEAEPSTVQIAESSARTVPVIKLDMDEPASDSSMEEPSDDITSGMKRSTNMSKYRAFRRKERLREETKFRRLYSVQKEKLELRKEELSIKRQKLELKKQKLELMKKQLAVHTSTLDQLKNISRIMESKYK